LDSTSSIAVGKIDLVKLRYALIFQFLTTCAGVFLCVVLLETSAIGFQAAAENRLTVAMITWRGETEAEQGFMDGLAKSPWQVSYLKFHANQDRARLYRMITQIRNASVDLIYVFGTTATQMVLSRIKDTPAVFNIVTRPVAAGIIAGWERSGNNATGASNQVPVHHQLKTLKKVINYTKLGVIYNPLEQNSIIQKNIVKSLESTLGFELKEYHVSRQSDVPKVIPHLQGAVDAVYLPADSMVKSLGKIIMAEINAFKIPSLSAVESMVINDGVLLGLVPNYYQLGRLAATKAIQIFMGKKPTEIPSSTLDYFHISVNLITAQKIGVQIPMSILVMASRIVR